MNMLYFYLSRAEIRLRVISVVPETYRYQHTSLTQGCQSYTNDTGGSDDGNAAVDNDDEDQDSIGGGCDEDVVAGYSPRALFKSRRKCLIIL